MSSRSRLWSRPPDSWPGGQPQSAAMRTSRERRETKEANLSPAVLTMTRWGGSYTIPRKGFLNDKYYIYIQYRYVAVAISIVCVCRACVRACVCARARARVCVCVVCVCVVGGGTFLLSLAFLEYLLFLFSYFLQDFLLISPDFLGCLAFSLPFLWLSKTSWATEQTPLDYFSFSLIKNIKSRLNLIKINLNAKSLAKVLNHQPSTPEPQRDRPQNPPRELPGMQLRACSPPN